MIWDRLRFMAPNLDPTPIPPSCRSRVPRGYLLGAGHSAGTERLLPERFVVAGGNGELFHAVRSSLEKRRIPAGELVGGGNGRFRRVRRIRFRICIRIGIHIDIGIDIITVLLLGDLLVSLEELGT